MLSWHWIKRVENKRTEDKAELKDRKARRIEPVWLKIMVLGEKHEERWRHRGAYLLHYRVEYREWRVCVSFLRVQSGINAHGERRSHVWIVRLLFFTLLLWSLTPLSGVSVIDPREKKSSQSYCQFYSVSSVAAILRLVIRDYFCTQDSPLNTEQCLPIAIIDNTVYNNESDGNNQSFSMTIIVLIIIIL